MSEHVKVTHVLLGILIWIKVLQVSKGGKTFEAQNSGPYCFGVDMASVKIKYQFKS